MSLELACEIKYSKSKSGMTKEMINNITSEAPFQ